MLGESNDQSGTVGLLAGLIVLVLVGVFFSMMVDKRFRSSSERLSVEETLARETPRLESARRELEHARELWQQASRPVAGQADTLTRLSGEVGESRERLAEMRARRESLESAVAAAAGSFRAYRAAYLAQARADAAGEKHAEIATPDGRTYREVTIRRVTSAGIEITHSDGISRLLPKDLDPAWHERFQWGREEVEKVLDEEKARAARHSQAIAGSRDAPETPVLTRTDAGKPPAPREANEKLAALRSEVIAARDRMIATETEAARARSEARAKRGRSVPGSLETWEARALRLEAAGSKWRDHYHSARGRLAAAAPGDPLLRDREP